MNTLLESKTARMWLIIIGVAVGVVVFATAAAALGYNVPFVTELFTLMGGGGTATTYRNVQVDGAIRRDAASNSYGPPPQ